VSLLKLTSCNPFVSLCKNSLIVDWRDTKRSRCLWFDPLSMIVDCSLRVGLVRPNWANISWCVLFLFSLYLLLVVLCFSL